MVFWKQQVDSKKNALITHQHQDWGHIFQWKWDQWKADKKYRDNTSHPFISMIVSRIQTSLSFSLLWIPHKMSHSGRCNAIYLPCRGSKFNTICFCVLSVPFHQYTFISYHKSHIFIYSMQKWTQSCYLHFQFRISRFFAMKVVKMSQLTSLRVC